MRSKQTALSDNSAHPFHLIQPSAGISFKSIHIDRILTERPDIGWFEVHSENYMGAGGEVHSQLGKIREHYPLSFHGVGLSLGSAEMPDAWHLARLKHLVEQYQPELVSEHLSWSIVEGSYLNDLLPLPYTEEALDIVCEHIDMVQEALQRTILVENPSSYMRFKHSTIHEADFLTAMACRTGCGLLLDVNNIYVSCCNVGGDPLEYLKAIPGKLVAEIHLAGHHLKQIEHEGAVREIRIDDHGSAVSTEVWDLFQTVLASIGPVPTLIEWDTDVPQLDILLAEADKAAALLKSAALMAEDQANAVFA